MGSERVQMLSVKLADMAKIQQVKLKPERWVEERRTR